MGHENLVLFILLNLSLCLRYDNVLVYVFVLAQKCRVTLVHLTSA